VTLASNAQEPGQQAGVLSESYVENVLGDLFIENAILREANFRWYTAVTNNSFTLILSSTAIQPQVCMVWHGHSQLLSPERDVVSGGGALPALTWLWSGQASQSLLSGRNGMPQLGTGKSVCVPMNKSL
jgi:hypothetical protein